MKTRADLAGAEDVSSARDDDPDRFTSQCHAALARPAVSADSWIPKKLEKCIHCIAHAAGHPASDADSEDRVQPSVSI